MIYYVLKEYNIKHFVVDGSPIHKFSHDYSSVALKFNIPSITSLFDSIDSIYVYKIMKSSINNDRLKILLPLNEAPYQTRFFQPFYPPIPKNVFSMKDPIFRLCTLGNKLCLLKPTLNNWEVSINIASNIISSELLNYC